MIHVPWIQPLGTPLRHGFQLDNFLLPHQFNLEKWEALENKKASEPKL
jgi:hypothetical protein